MPSLTRRKTAANLAKEMMPGPRLHTLRPTVSRFTLRKQVTVVPRNNRKHTVRVRKTAGNLAKRIRDLPGHIQRMKVIESNQARQLENERALLGGINTNNRYKSTPGNGGFHNRLRAKNKRETIKRIRFYENLLKTTRSVSEKLRREKQQYNNPKRSTLTVRSIEAPKGLTETAPMPHLPGIVEEENNNNK
jgi:hypothetical protein